MFAEIDLLSERSRTELALELRRYAALVLKVSAQRPAVVVRPSAVVGTRQRFPAVCRTKRKKNYKQTKIPNHSPTGRASAFWVGRTIYRTCGVLWIFERYYI